MSAVSAQPAGLSIREFARREGCDDKLVRRALEKGRLKALPDGTLDPDLVGTGWRKSNRQGVPGADTSADIRSAVRAGMSASSRVSAAHDETPAEAAERIVTAGGAPYDIGEAERIKENYLALLRQLEYDLKSGAVVLVAEVAKAVGEEYARVRTRLLAIAAEQAPRLHRCKTVTELQDALHEVIVEALEELTRDGAPAPS